MKGTGVSEQLTEDRKQKSDRMLHLTAIIICLRSYELCPLKSDT